ncbi:GNAT family N-acetyltransferase [Blastopirellula sp. JC732]|uniref:GNAT family N-acetyltransferase n=1 Tax=Blastopirellula sediminis TaxID=2894196 RepID=A0A9X1MNN1_9BACT|nr:GNAT family N-acetyltransferase [Blastopirellula sediminis]MCC9607202.1 GNAT family N-acetyltransferase [Blastopirellula sediminis]MCC9629505.1 GNAT family N-acetyltransferase [Blastopirellula sediminis]
MSIRQVDALCEAQLVQLTELFQNLWWTPGRQLEDVRIAVGHSSLVIALIDEAADDRLVGFCRLLTDFTYRAMLYDVVVDPAYRGKGLGQRLINAVIAHPRLASVETIALACAADMAPFYERFGFQTQDSELLTMRRKKIL